MAAWIRRILTRQAVKGLPTIESLSHVRVTAQDTLVLEVASKLSQAQVEAISNAVHGAFPGGPLLILDAGMHLRLVRDGAKRDAA